MEQNPSEVLTPINSDIYDFGEELRRLAETNRIWLINQIKDCLRESVNSGNKTGTCVIAITPPGYKIKKVVHDYQIMYSGYSKHSEIEVKKDLTRALGKCVNYVRICTAKSGATAELIHVITFKW